MWWSSCRIVGEEKRAEWKVHLIMDKHGIIVMTQTNELGVAWLWWWLEHKGRKWILPLCREMT